MTMIERDVLRKSTRPHPRAPGGLYSLLSIVLVVLVAAATMTSREASAPTIAEFAPQAVEQITDSSGDAGSSGGASGETSAPDDPTDERAGAEATIDVARVRQCVGDPPRQIEDPQSPPCVPFWSGDNGGATSHGVTRDEVRITDANGMIASYGRWDTFFNKRFEFYGRRIRLVRRTVPEDAGAGERAAARAAYEQDQVFASMPVCCTAGHTYLDELARLGVVGVHFNPLFPETYLTSRRPYLWTYPMANDRLFKLEGDWYCARFAGRNAVHAGDPVIQMTRRKAGIILLHANWEGTSAEPLNAQLATCGSRTNAIIHDTNQTFDAAFYATFMENAILQMKAAGVTTVICLCSGTFLPVAGTAATNQGYFPEWLISDYIYNDSLSRHMWASREQTRNYMFLSVVPMHRAPAEHPSLWALHEIGDHDRPPTSGDIWGHDVVYRALLLLASGIQMAGPNLTPETFERGLHRTRFPNPAVRTMPGAVGFENGDHSMTNDAAEMWWGSTAPTPYGDGLGTFCYVDHGARRRMGTFPTDDPFFEGECDNGVS